MNTIRAQIEAEYQAAQDALAAKFKPLLDAVAAFDSETTTKRARKRNKSTPDVAGAANDTILPPPNTQTTDDEEYEKTEFFHDVNLQLGERLLAAGADGMSKRELQAETGYSESVLDQSIKHLVKTGSVEKFGNRRGTKYRAAAANVSEASNGNS